MLEILREAGELEDDGVKDVLEHHVEVLILGLMIADGYLDSCARPAAAIKIEKFDMIRKA